ncbi:MAG: TIR domain-containing protein [Ktedonobacteraceae bacterium]|nr:TIR domain-containing protein [Ktedonobacteraceae bacterium]
MSLLANRAQVVKVFLSCADEDRKFLHLLERQLSSLIREGRIESWHRYKVGVGSEWKKQAKEYLTVADIILLLISPDFVASDY